MNIGGINVCRDNGVSQLFYGADIVTVKRYPLPCLLVLGDLVLDIVSPTRTLANTIKSKM